MRSKARLQRTDHAADLERETQSGKPPDSCQRQRVRRKPARESIPGCASKGLQCRPRRSRGCLLAWVQPRPSANKEQRPRICESKNFCLAIKSWSEAEGTVDKRTKPRSR